MSICSLPILSSGCYYCCCSCFCCCFFQNTFHFWTFLGLFHLEICPFCCCLKAVRNTAVFEILAALPPYFVKAQLRTHQGRSLMQDTEPKTPKDLVLVLGLGSWSWFDCWSWLACCNFSSISATPTKLCRLVLWYVWRLLYEFGLP